MKRHPSLIPLSHDHHDALVVAQGLILGRSKAPRSDWPTARRAQVDRVVAFFAQTLWSHFEVEETHLFPAVIAHLPGAADLVGQLLDEHDAMRTRMRDLERDPTTDLDVRLPSLGRLLDAHVRREERVLFATMQREMDPADLESLGTRLRRRAPDGASCRLSSTVANTRADTR
ncbi:MAG: hemerythrin domain-containing protein [Acidobacteria bacterium]|jgi:iron-sulfur cluster repair protein YtfE (RIC family)|nr:MAG: hemerythrin domain-containing protein [Acidobacteriota bacterium]